MDRLIDGEAENYSPEELELKKNLRPLSFDDFAEGKKISWKDGFRAIYCILKYNL